MDVSLRVSVSKPHIALGNTRQVGQFWRGKLKGWKPWMNRDRPTTRKYLDRAGRKRWNGSKHLKGTQSGPCSWQLKLFAQALSPGFWLEGGNVDAPPPGEMPPAFAGSV